MFQNFLDDRGVFNTGDDLDLASTTIADRDIDIAYRDVGKEREQDAEALNTRLSRCAQVISLYLATGGALPLLLVSCFLHLPLPRFAHVTLIRYLLFGARTR